MTPQTDGFESFSLLAVDDDELSELHRLLDGHPTLDLQDLVVDDASGRLLDLYPSHTPSPAVWDRIKREISAPPGVVRPLDSAPSSKPKPSRRWVAAFGAVAAAALLVAGVGAIVANADMTTEELYAAEAATLAGAANSAVLTLNDPVSATPAASVVVGEDGTAFFVFDGLDSLEPGQTYQLWAVVDGEVVSAALLGPEGDTLPIRLEANPEVLAVTVESSGGVVVSDQEPVAVWAAGA